MHSPDKSKVLKRMFYGVTVSCNSAVVSHVRTARRFHLHGVASRNCLLPKGELT